MAGANFSKFWHSCLSGDSYVAPPDLLANQTETPPPKYTEHAEFVPTVEEHAKRPPKVYAIAVMGPTGSGKSTLISKLANRRIEIGHRLSSCTKDVEEVPCKIGNKHVKLVDTPGFSDTTRSDTEILGILVDWMKDSHKEIQLSGIIYLHSIQDVRMYGSSLQNLRMFRRLCGDKNLKNVVLATTKWEITPESDAISREQELCSNDDFWGLMIKAGSEVRRCENTKAGARFLIEEILRIGEDSITPQIQHEVVELGKPLAETTAGVYINDALIEQAKKHEEDVKALKEEQGFALKEHDREMQVALEKQQKKLEQQIAAREEEQRILHLNEMSALQQRLHNLEQSSNGEYINKQGFWRSSWKCLVCKKRSDSLGPWTCPNCRFKQRNVAWEP